MSYFCYCQAKQDKRMRHLEEKVGLPPASPLRPFVDPYVECDNNYGHQFDDEEQHDTEDYQEFEQQQGFQQPSAFDPTYGVGIPKGYTVEDTEAGFAYQDLFSGADGITKLLPPVL
jgi:hypothetical protein